MDLAIALVFCNPLGDILGQQHICKVSLVVVKKIKNKKLLHVKLFTYHMK